MSFAYIYIVPLSILVVYGNILCTYSGYLNAGSRFHAYTIAGSWTNLYANDSRFNVQSYLQNWCLLTLEQYVDRELIESK